jgi:pyruvate, water dikinase
MASIDVGPSTGIAGLDKILCNLLPGDNVVWQVERIEDYAELVRPYVQTALDQGRKLVYFRFARHAPVVESDPRIEVVELDPQMGFERFLDGIHSVVARAGIGAYYVFDSLSDLTADWYCDQMLGNFFQLTCPYLYRLDTIAYFALLRSFHSFYALVPISETTQLLLEVYRYHEKLYVQPLKVEGRSSPQMFMLHVLDGEATHPVTESPVVSEILTSSPRSALGLSQYQLGVWTRTFVQAEALLEQSKSGLASPEAEEAMFHRLLRMAISRDERVLALAERYFDLGDMVAIGRRLLGTGLIGGKSVGMLLARAILERSSARWNELLEVHDSFYIPSDVFYTFLVRNGCWEFRKRRLHSTDYLEGSDEARERVLSGTFPPHIEKRFMDMLDYFGQSPIIVRSSSLLEDNFGNSFAGKYDSVFCANQGSREERIASFLEAVKMVYASTVSRPALDYRARFGLLDRDEQMALLVQRVSGQQEGHFHFPQIAGAAFSFNPYVWDESIDPDAGMVRLVFGLGTRAVDRSDDDYTRLVALNAPQRRPDTEKTDGMVRHSQHKVDLLDLDTNELATRDFNEVAKSIKGIPMDLFSARDRDVERLARERGRRLEPGASRVIRFDRLLSESDFVRDMREMLRTLHEAYDHPVDIEFTANFTGDGRYTINLVQCRPFQVKGSARNIEVPAEIPQEDTVLQTCGPVIGQSRIDTIERIIYVVPHAYGQLPVKERYAVARLIGRLNQLNDGDSGPLTLLMGPGRWGTTTASLGVPVAFAEINTVSILCEIVAMRDDLVPDVSMGTHFFSELVEMDMVYLALFPNHEGNRLNREFLEGAENQLTKLLPDAGDHEHLVRVIDPAKSCGGRSIELYADVLKQQVLCFVAP